jgi:anti-anti-sigma factor
MARRDNMSAPQGFVRIRQEEDTVTFRVEGWVTMNHSLPLRRCAEHCLKEGATVRVDLRHCIYMDSTFLGTLLFLHRAAAKGTGKFVLISPSTQCGELFRQVGLEDGFTLAADAEEPNAEDWTILTNESKDKCAFTHNVVQAHQELATLPGPAGDQFRAVVRCLARDTAPEQGK